MNPWTRRQFLAAALASAGSAAHAANHRPKAGTRLGNLTFLEEFPRVFDAPFDEGLDGRLITDLSTLSEQTLITPNEHFYIRTRTPDQIDLDKPWFLSIGGLVSQPRTFGTTELLDLAEPQGEVLLECSGNNRRNRSFGLLSAADWEGVPMASLLNMLNVNPKATRVLINGFDTHSQEARGSVPGASWIFSFDQLEKYGAFLATHMNGQRISRDHGFPIRLMVPSWYGCCCVKWVNRIELVDDTAAATGQMLEFATRTHQEARHPLAKDYNPATMDQAAMPVRVEKWKVNGNTVYQVVGVMWGGDTLTQDLLIRFHKDEKYVPVQNVLGQPARETWGLWTHTWTPAKEGRHDITLKVADPTIRTRRLDVEYYRRSVHVGEV